MDVSYYLRLLFFLSLLFLPHIFSDLAADRAALLRFQAAVRGRTRLWNATSTTPCSWDGVECDSTTNRVVGLRLPGDGLTGEIPVNSIGNLTELKILSLRNNNLSGPIPHDLASCTLLQELHLPGNSFSGEIPSSFFTLTNLLRVNLARNNFSGGLSSRFNSLTRLNTLYLENNQFTGPLPDLSSLNDLGQFNVSFNGLTGSVPSSLNSYSSQSFLGTSLCGGPLVSCPSAGPPNSSHDAGGNSDKLPRGGNSGKLSGGAIAGIAVGSSLVVILIIVVIFLSWISKHKSADQKLPTYKNDKSTLPSPSPVKLSEDQNRNIPSSMNTGFVFFGEDVGVSSLRDLLTSSAQVMGKGTVGSTYKAYLDNGVEIIVKRLKPIYLSQREFKGKIEELGSICHENLGSLRGYFSGRDENLLIYDPLPKGSLYQLLHGKKQQHLSWKIRAKIAVGAARGINHLHSINSATTHGNIKSSNIFLTDEYEPRVSEYGLTQLVSSISTANGYRAPEVTDTRKVSQQADVYSFGVLLLELLTGKAPDNDEGIVLPSWVQSVVEEKWTIQVFDSELIKYELDLEENMVQLLHLAISCTALHPHRRPSMLQIMPRIEEICASGN